MAKTLKVVCISDTHGRHRKLKIPDGDILIHAGDSTNMGALDELKKIDKFLGKFPHPHKILIAGNHDFTFEYNLDVSREVLKNVIYLQDEEIEIEGLRIYGSPWQPAMHDWAFNLPRGEALRKKWALIPKGIDILVTHTPPYGYGDEVGEEGHAGCFDLLRRVQELKPRYHVFGHIHDGYGIFETKDTTFINASICDGNYRAVHKPIVFEITVP